MKSRAGAEDRWWRLLRAIAFRLDPELSHRIGLWAIARGFVRARPFSDPRLEQTLFGLRFPNPLGLAAGFDKDGIAAHRWGGLGFGFAELGTVTPVAQPGNPRPRLYRLPGERAIVNRMGFNNSGANALAARLAKARALGPIGVNIGKGRETPTPSAPADYAECVRLLRGRADYFVANVSSPNTPGLRRLQDPGPLSEILAAVREVDPGAPLFVKVSPDLEPAALEALADLAVSTRVTGLVATNTTMSRSGLSHDPRQEGGLSGAPLRERADAILARLYRIAGEALVVIGVGGVFTGEDAYRKLRLGASLVQLYTGFVYGGPTTAPRVLRELAQLLDRDGVRDLDEIRGVDAR